MTNFHTDPDGKRWMMTSGYNGYRRGADGRMHYDVHTGQGRRTVWVEVIPPKICEHCGDEVPGDYWASRKHTDRRCTA